MKGIQLLALLSALLSAAASAFAAEGDQLYAHPGQLVAAEGTRLNLYCLGQGSPVVVFDSGWEDWAPVWALVQPKVAQFTQACSYDRAGAGFSDPGRMPRSSVRIAGELHAVLHKAQIRGPYILVGHAFGGDNVRTFAMQFTREVAGLVLVEADVAEGDQQGGRARYIASLRACRDSIAAGKALPTLSSHPGEAPRDCAQQFFRGLPEATWSPELNASLLTIARTKIAMYEAYASEMEQMPEDERFLAKNSHSLGSRPIRVLTTGYHGVHALDSTRPLDPAQRRYQEQVAQAQAEWLALSSNSSQLFTDKSSEYIPLDEPDFVVQAIREVHRQSH